MVVPLGRQHVRRIRPLRGGIPCRLFLLSRFFDFYCSEDLSGLSPFRNQADPRNTCPLERTEFSWVGRGQKCPLPLWGPDSDSEDNRTMSVGFLAPHFVDSGGR